jgi:hypothetical protein
MKNRTIELIEDLIPLFPGMGLALGYICALVVISPFFPVFIPYNVVSVAIEEPIFEKKIIGKVPKNHPVDGKSDGYRFIEKEVPVLSQDGRSIIKKRNKSFKGRGTHKIIVEESEITIPRMGDPPYVKEGKLQVIHSGQVFPPGKHVPGTEELVLFTFYTENIEYEGTGFFYKKKKVQFDIGIDPKEWSIFGGIIGTIISLIFFIKKHVM